LKLADAILELEKKNKKTSLLYDKAMEAVE